MRRRLFICALLLLATPAAPAGAASHKTCRPAHSTTVAKSSLVRVYRRQVGHRDYPTAFACNMRTGRSVQLDNRYDSDLLEGRGFPGSRPKIAGRFLLYVIEYQEGAAEPEGLFLLDIKSRRVRNLASCLDDYDSWVSVFLLTARGNVACSRRTYEDDYQILAIPSGEAVRVVDSSSAVDEESLALAADRRHITWTSGGVTKTARF